MTKFVHIVQVHPVENGVVQTHNVVMEYELPTKEQVDYFIELYEIMNKTAHLGERAVYYGYVGE